MSRWLCLFLIVTMPMFRLYGQQFGEIKGTVTDATGASIAGAQITVTNTATQQTRRVASNEAGLYSVPFLVPGPYSLTAEKTGFKLSTRRGVEVQGGDVSRIDFPMQLGEISQAVEVSAGAPQLNTESVALGARK